MRQTYSLSHDAEEVHLFQRQVVRFVVKYHASITPPVLTPTHVLALEKCTSFALLPEQVPGAGTCLLSLDCVSGFPG